MDEAERCHEIAYISNGRLLTHGTIDEVMRQAGLTTFNVTGKDLTNLAAELTGQPGIDMVVPFGASLHVSGRSAPALEAAIAPYRADPQFVWTQSEPMLEDVFIDLMGRARDTLQ
jgi:ABC-2 type transport system ATP-binding protein